MSLLSTITGFLGLSFSGEPRSEGQYRPGPYYLPYSGGWLSAEAGQNWNWWQMGYDIQSGGGTAMVEACISAYAQTVAMCPGNHWLLHDDGGRERITNSALARVLKRPNEYQSISDFLLNAVRWVYYEGNAYALAVRNDRYEITQLHLMDSRQSQAQLAYNGEIFYDLGGNEVVERQIGPNLKVPARDVLHVKLHTPRHPLKGETPLMAAALQQAATSAALEQQLRFFANQARPSFVLTTDQILTKEQVEVIRERWNEQAKGLNSGGTPILTAGLKADKLTVSAQDNAVIDLLKLSDGAIATVLRIPSALVNQGSQPFSSTEALMQFWLASGLGFILNHFEEAIGNLFKLKGQPEEYLEFDTGALLRSAYKDRVEAEVRAVQGGLKSPNEARAELELPEVEYGEEPRVQQQVVPLSAWGKQLEAPTQPPGQPAAPADVPAKVKPGEDGEEPEPEEPPAAEKKDIVALFREELRLEMRGATMTLPAPSLALPLALPRYNPNQPRDPGGEGGGQWVKVGGGDYVEPKEQRFKPRAAMTPEEEAAYYEQAKKDQAVFDRYSKTFEGSYDVNNGLRGNQPMTDDALKLTTDLDDVFARTPGTRERQEFYRGMAVPDDSEFLARLKPGAVMTDPAFLSTSFEYEAAERFTQHPKRPADPGVFINIRIPRGSKTISGDSFFEAEQLLPRGSSLKINSVDRKVKDDLSWFEEPRANDLIYVDADYIPPGYSGIKMAAKAAKPSKAATLLVNLQTGELLDPDMPLPLWPPPKVAEPAPAPQPEEQGS